MKKSYKQLFLESSRVTGLWMLAVLILSFILGAMPDYPIALLISEGGVLLVGCGELFLKIRQQNASNVESSNRLTPQTEPSRDQDAPLNELELPSQNFPLQPDQNVSDPSSSQKTSAIQTV